MCTVHVGFGYRLHLIAVSILCSHASRIRYGPARESRPLPDPRSRLEILSRLCILARRVACGTKRGQCQDIHGGNSWANQHRHCNMFHSAHWLKLFPRRAVSRRGPNTTSSTLAGETGWRNHMHPCLSAGIIVLVSSAGSRTFATKRSLLSGRIATMMWKKLSSLIKEFDINFNK